MEDSEGSTEPPSKKAYPQEDQTVMGSGRKIPVGDFPLDKGAPAPPLLEWLATRGAMRGSVLVPGCGLGYDVRAIAAASPEARVVGVDLAPSALDRARQFPPAGTERYEQVDV